MFMYFSFNVLLFVLTIFDAPKTNSYIIDKRKRIENYPLKTNEKIGNKICEI